MSRRQSHQPAINSTYSIEMLHRYPFETPVPQSYNAVVRMTRRFHDTQYEELRLKVQSHSQLRHPSLIRIMRATVNRNARHFNIYYEYVSHNLRNQIGDMTLKQIRDNELRLFDLCSQLMSINIYPEVAEELLGITQNGIIKLYLDVDYRELTGNENKQDLLMAKEIEINSIFNKYLSEVPSIKALKHYKSAPSIKGYSITTIPFSPMAKKSMTRDNELLRESEVIETANYIPRTSIRNAKPIKDESFVHCTGFNQQTFSREQMKRQYADSQVPTAHEAYESRHRRHRRQTNHTGQLYSLHNMPLGDHESHYTYHQEMGEAAQMPKISVTGLRQTAPTSKLQNKISAQEEYRLNQRQIYEQGYDQGQKNFAKQKMIGGGHSKRPTAVSSSQIQSEQRNWAPQTSNSTVKPLQKPEPSQPQTKHKDNNNHRGYWQAMNSAASKQYHHEQQQVEVQQLQQPQQNAELEPEVEQVEQAEQSQSQRKQNSQKLQTRPGNEYMYMDSEDPLTKEFNNLFDSHLVHNENEQTEQPQPPPRESIRTNPRQSTHKGSEAESERNLINQRVQKALEKSRAMLNYFYANNPQKQPML